MKKNLIIKCQLLRYDPLISHQLIPTRSISLTSAIILRYLEDKMFMNKYFISISLLLLLASYAHPNLRDASQKAFANGLITFGSGDTIEQHIQDIMITWPHAYAVAKVTVVGNPGCSTPEKGKTTDGKTTYCNVKVETDTLFLGNWSHLNRAKNSSEDSFMIHYWYSNDKVFEIRSGERLIVFLAPTHSYEIYSATGILKVTDDTINAVRRATEKLNN